MIAAFVYPAGKAGHVAVGAGIGRAASQQDNSGSARIGHGHIPHQLADSADDDGKDFATQAKRWCAGKFERGMALASGSDGGGNVFLHVACGIEDQRQYHHPLAISRSAIQTGIK